MSESGRAYRALLIGNSEFPGDPEHLRTLLGPPTDVPLLAAALTDPDTGLHQADAVRTVLEETTQSIRDELAEFFDSALPHEQLFLYYSGHGLLDLRNRLRLCARDTTVGRLQARSVELEFIDGLIAGCASRSIVVVLDCCFSGAAAVKGDDPVAKLEGDGRFVMTSSSHGDTSADAEAAGVASPFTRHLVTGLRSGAPGRDGLVTTYDIYRYIHGQLRASGQVPHMKMDAGVGAIPLARRPPRPAETAATDDPARVGDDAAPFDARPVLSPAPEEYKADSGYRRLRRAALRVPLWLSTLVPETLAQGALTGPTWYERVGTGTFTLALGVSVILALWALGDVWTFLRIRSMLRSSGLYAISMVMETGMVEEAIVSSFDFTSDSGPWAWLRYEDTSLVPPPTQDELSGVPLEEEGVKRPELSVPLQHFHRGNIAQWAHVKVIGTPRPGCWVVIHTANGMLWPRARAR